MTRVGELQELAGLLNRLSARSPAALTWTVSDEGVTVCPCDQAPSRPTTATLHVELTSCPHELRQTLPDGTGLAVTPAGDAALSVAGMGSHTQSNAWWRDPQNLARIHQNALILHQLLLGRLVLHGSAVVIGGLAAVTIGPSGAGKSTTAAALVELGAGMLADDVVAIAEVDGRMFVWHTESRAKVGESARPPDSKSVERQAPPSESPVDPIRPDVQALAPLGLVTVLTAAPATGDGVEDVTSAQTHAHHDWSRLRGSAAFESVWQYGGGERGLQVLGRDQYVQRIASVVNAAPVWRLHRGMAGPSPDHIAAGIASRLGADDR